jgi:phage protein U
MMLSLGQFVFSIQTAAYQQLERASEWRHSANQRVGARPAAQYVGPGEDTITLEGLLLPELTGDRSNLDQLRDMAATGSACPLVDGSGVVYGAWVLTRLNETSTLFFADGTPRRVEFTLALRRVDDARVADNPRVGGTNDGQGMAGMA